MNSKEIQILVNKSFDFVVTVDEHVVFNGPVDCIDGLEIVASLCRYYPISTGESTLALYKFFDEKIEEIRAEKAETIMNQKFFSRVA